MSKTSKKKSQDKTPEQNTPDSGGVPVNGELVANGNKVLFPTKDAKGEVKITATRYAGPLPPPDILQAYNEVCPHLADKIAESYVNEGNHRRAMEIKNHELDEYYLNEAVKEGRLGSWLAFILCTLCLLVSGYAMVNGAQYGGSALGVTGLAGLIYAFKSGIKLPQPYEKSPEQPAGKSPHDKEKTE